MYSERLVIFEGPDGVGKTTLAKAWADKHGAVYSHMHAFPSATRIATYYAQAMAPAVLGLAPVALDRCWISEPIYARAYNRSDRVGTVRSRILERLAWRCQTTVVRCLAPWEKAVANYRSRKEIEYLKNEEQLYQVYKEYDGATYPGERLTSLPMITIDPLDAPTVPYMLEYLNEKIEEVHSEGHWLSRRTAGNCRAKTLIVDGGPEDHKDGDAGLRWPLSSFATSSESFRWTHILEDAGLGEELFYWAFASDITSSIRTNPVGLIVVMDDVSESAVRAHGRHAIRGPEGWEETIACLKKELLK